MTADGAAPIHTIGRVQGAVMRAGWMLKYIFPGGYVRLHYARTLAEWRARFEARLPELRAMHHDRFIRMWRYYLVACQATFEVDRQCVFQMQFARAADTVPLSRDDIAPAEARALHAAE